MRLPLAVATVVLLVVGVIAGAVALGSGTAAERPPVEPIVVEAPAAPPAAPAGPAQPAPRDHEGYVAPPPPVDDDDEPDDDGPDDDD